MQLTRIRLENFKAQRDADIDVRRFNILTGYNSAGKTTVLQALVFVKQSLTRSEITYNDYLLRLGDFKELVHTHDESLAIGIALDFEDDGHTATYELKVSRMGTAEAFSVDGSLAWRWDSTDIRALEPSGRVFLAQAAAGHGGGEYIQQPSAELAALIIPFQRKVVEWFENMLYLSSSRGFTKYSYPLLAGQPSTEEVAKRAGDASLLEEWLSNLIMYRINESQRYPKMRAQLDAMRERLGRVGVDINPYVMNGPSVVIDLTEGDMWVSAVNSGYGINQLVSSVVLGTLLEPGTLVAIEEPEIHLHPKMQRIFCNILVEIAGEGKQVVITSHSEHFLATLAEAVEAGKLTDGDIQVYHFFKGGEAGRQTCAELVDVHNADQVHDLFY